MSDNDIVEDSYAVDHCAFGVVAGAVPAVLGGAAGGGVVVVWTFTVTGAWLRGRAVFSPLSAICCNTTIVLR